MKKLLAVLLLLSVAVAAMAATSTSNCTATLQGLGACGAGDNGEAGVLIAYWASSIDDAPADSEVASNAVDLRDAICAHFRVATCTSATADGALRKWLVDLMRAHRKGKKTTAIPALPTPVLDSQNNP